ncbi:MAG: AMP-binding protein [Myxococcales bacterium]|nr:AMP-binding protein [Myxococcales bacterium]
MASTTALLEGSTFWDLVEGRAQATPDAVMLVDEHDRTLRFAEFRDAALRVAAGLHDLGVGPGSKVSYQLPTRFETTLLMAALARLGAVQNPLVPMYREAEIAFCLAQTGAELLITPGAWKEVDYAELAAEATRGLDTRVHHFAPDLPSGDPAALPPPPASGDEVRWIYYTSGTTGSPKGVLHSDASVATSSRGLAERHQLHSGDVFGVAFPFTHVGGLMNLVSVLVVGHRLVLLETFEPAAAVRVFAREGVTIIGGGPVFYAAFLAEQRKQPDTPILPNFRMFSGGGAPMPSELHYEVQREMGGRGCLHGFGMTECGIVTSNDPDDSDEHLAHTDGRPGLGVELQVQRFGGGTAAIGEEGPVRLRGAAVCKGYLDPAAHAEAFDAEGWFHTGDVGFRDADGYVTLTGRVKDIIIRKGENISANEIEDLLYAHPNVADVAVIGLPDPARGELVCAVVAPTADAASFDFSEMVAYLRRAQIMPQKIPERLELVDAIPRNATGKILKQELRDRFV